MPAGKIISDFNSGVYLLDSLRLDEVDCWLTLNRIDLKHGSHLKLIGMFVILEVRHSYVIYLNLISIENVCVAVLAYCIKTELKSDINHWNKKTVLWEIMVLFLYSVWINLLNMASALSISELISEHNSFTILELIF